MKLSPIVFLLLGANTTALSQDLLEKLETAYTEQRAAAVAKLNQTAAQQAAAVAKAVLQAQNLAGATAATEWSQRLTDADPQNDVEGLAANPASRDPLVALQTRYLKARGEALAQVTRTFLAHFEAAQRQAMQKGSLPEASVPRSRWLS